jgi:hypothetical protein
MAAMNASSHLLVRLLSSLALVACASSPEVRDDEARTAAPGTNEAMHEPAREVPIDVRARPPVSLRLEVVDANDATRGAHLATQLERFRRCVDRYRAARGFAGGRFSMTGFIQPDGTLTRSSVMALEYGDGFERCLEPDVAALTWPPTGLDVMVGFTAAVVVHDDASRRAPDEVRPTFPTHDVRRQAAPSRAPQLGWSALTTTSSSVDAWRDELVGRSAVLSDCLWHAWPTSSPSAEAVVVVRIAPNGELSARVRGEHETPAPELVECLGRLLSVMSVPAGTSGEVRGHLTVGFGGGSLTY